MLIKTSHVNGGRDFGHRGETSRGLPISRVIHTVLRGANHFWLEQLQLMRLARILFQYCGGGGARGGGGRGES